MTTPQPTSGTAPRRVRIALDKLKPLAANRPLDDDHVSRISESIARVGLQQPPGAIDCGDHFELAFGAHRVEALRRLGERDVECIVWPQGTCPHEALVRSLHENYVRRDESLSETMRRVTTLMRHHGCKTLAQGACVAGLSPATLSKLQFVFKKLTPQSLATIHKNNLGISVAYGVAKAAPSSDSGQAELLAAHVDGQLTRDDIARRSKAATRPRTNRRTSAPKLAKPRPVTLIGKIDGIGVRLTIPLVAEHDAVRAALGVLCQRLDVHLQTDRPLSEFSFS